MELIRQRLLDKRAKLTKSEVRTAAWLEANLERLAFLTVQEVAREAGVSEATIVRFSRKLDFESYTEMQRVAQENLRRRFFLGDRLESTSQTPREGARAIFDRDMRNLRSTYEYLNDADFDSSVEAIRSASRVLVLGLRASSAVSVYLSFCLGLLRPRVEMLDQGWDNLREQLIDIGPGDVLIAISRGRPAKGTVDAAVEARSKYGATVVALAGSSISPLAQTANFVLVASGEEGFSNFTSTFSLAGALVEGVAGAMRTEAAERLRKLDEINDASYSFPLLANSD